MNSKKQCATSAGHAKTISTSDISISQSPDAAYKKGVARRKREMHNKVRSQMKKRATPKIKLITDKIEQNKRRSSAYRKILTMNMSILNLLKTQKSSLSDKEKLNIIKDKFISSRNIVSRDELSNHIKELDAEYTSLVAIKRDLSDFYSQTVELFSEHYIEALKLTRSRNGGVLVATQKIGAASCGFACISNDTEKRTPDSKKYDFKLRKTIFDV